jgi:hypothetical protein
MRKKIIQFPMLMMLLIGSAMMALSLIFVVVVGVLTGLFAEIFKLSSRISIRELKAYKIAKPVEKETLILKPKIVVFKLPHFPEKVRSKRLFLSRMSEKELSEAR